MDFPLLLTLSTSAFAFIAGVLLLIVSSRTIDRFFLILFFLLIGLANAILPMMVNASNVEQADAFAYPSLIFFWCSFIAIFYLFLLFPYDFAMIASPLRKKIFFSSFLLITIIIAILTIAIVGTTQENGNYWFDKKTSDMGFTIGFISFTSIAIIMALAYLTSEYAKKAALRLIATFTIFLVFLIIYARSGTESENWYWVDIGFLTIMSLLTYQFIGKRIELIIPSPEILSTGMKSSYRLSKGRIYVIEEDKPRFGFELFSVILRNRCYDCHNDESFVCESLDCSTCTLPCPCKECTQYPNRTQGLVIARRHPKEIRSDYFVQTTPIIWLTSLPGRDNMDPAKLSLLTDLIVKFIERTKNSVVLVEGIEYLITANNFLKVLKAIDRWSEVIMANSSRLIISLDPKAFDMRELALIERNREIVIPSIESTVEKILAFSS